MRDGLTPSNSTMCWSEEDSIFTISETGWDGAKYLNGIRGHIFNDEPWAEPPKDGEDWHCHILASVDGVNLKRKTKEIGFLHIFPEQHCFSDWVKVIVQQHDKYLDREYSRNVEHPCEYSNCQSHIYIGQRYQSFLIPAEFDVLLDVGPSVQDDDDQCTGYGNFKF
jgi:hypothetical protein